MKKHEITMAEVKAMEERGIDTMSLKDNSPRGVKTKSTSQVKLGDKIVIVNYFHTVIN